jgi:hypothetical protein
MKQVRMQIGDLDAVADRGWGRRRHGTRIPQRRRLNSGLRDGQ